MIVNELVEYLKKCDDAYYNTSNPLVSDAQYDAMVDTLRKIDPENAYLSKVGAKVRESTEKIGRVVPMGTLKKYHVEEDVREWLSEEPGDILVSPKYDGFALELIYKEGSLVSASTRGDGFVGEDVLASAMKIRNIPLRLYPPFNKLERVRGEVIIPRHNHEAIKALGYAAMRNAVPGIVRSNRTDALMLVDFVAYEFFDGDEDRVFQRALYRNIFTVEDFRLYDSNDISGINERRDELGNSRDSYEYELDGIVLKSRRIKEDDLLSPYHMIAWKYKSGRETTILRGIEYQLGATGYFTPIGIFDPVEFQGAVLTRASLGNMTRLHKEFEGMTIGSMIEVSRRGDIIPYIESLILVESRGERIPELTHCPYCGEELAYEEYEPHCINKECPEILRLKISQFVKSVGIRGIGDSLIRGLIDAGFIKSIKDVYSMNPSHILELPRQGESAMLKWDALQSKKLSALELLSAYPFVDLGKKVWEKVLSRFSYSEILDIDEDTLRRAQLRGVGDTKISSIVSQVREAHEDLWYLGVVHNVL